jgi:thioesterase domain-containing protein
VTGGIWGDRLQVSWSFSRNSHRAETITRLAEEFRREVLALAGSPAVALQPEGAGRPLFLMHPSGGQVMCYLGLARRMGRARPVYGLRAFDAEGVFDQSLEAMAQRQIGLIREVQPCGPYHLAGWSFGAVLAYEVARQLKAGGEQVDLLGIFDIAAPLAEVTAKLAELNGAEANELEEFDPETGDPRVLARLIGKLAGRDFEVGTSDLVGLSHAQQVSRVLELASRAGAVPEGMSETDALRALKGYQSRQRAAKNYKIGPYEGRVTVFLGRGASAEELRLRRELFGADETVGWSSIVSPRPEVVTVEGGHQTLVLEPHVESLSEKLRESLEKAETFV